jgi:hypothetical protein
MTVKERIMVSEFGVFRVIQRIALIDLPKHVFNYTDGSQFSA